MIILQKYVKDKVESIVYRRNEREAGPLVKRKKKGRMKDNVICVEQTKAEEKQKQQCRHSRLPSQAAGNKVA